MAEIKNCRVRAVDIERDTIHGYGARVLGYTAADVTLTIMLPPGSDGLLPNNLMDRKITVTIEPTPGEAAYLKWQTTETPRSVYSARPWEQLEPSKRAEWEQIAQAAVKAR